MHLLRMPRPEDVRSVSGSGFARGRNGNRKNSATEGEGGWREEEARPAFGWHEGQRVETEDRRGVGAAMIDLPLWIFSVLLAYALGLITYHLTGRGF